MKRHTIHAAIVALLMTLQIVAQLPPTTAPSPKPLLKRDRTRRVLTPRIIQAEDERAVASDLIDFLGLQHGGIRRRAIVALGRIGSPAAIVPLTVSLNTDRDARTRALAAFALGEIESHYAVPALLEKLQDAKEAAIVRARIVEALGKIAANRLSGNALGKYGVTGIRETLERLLPDPAQPVSEDAKVVASLTFTALLRIKQAASVPAITGQLRSSDADLRWQAANALARIREGIGPAVPSLIGLLTDKDALARANAARALGAAGDKTAVEPLLRLLADEDERVVASAINALGQIADPRAVEALVTKGTGLLEGYRSFNRQRSGVPTQQNLLLLIATALGNIKDPRSLPFLKSIRLADGKLGASPEVEIAVAKFSEAAFFDVPQGVGLPKDDWKAMAAYAQGLGQLGTERAKTILLDLLAGKTYGAPDPRAVSDILNALAAVKAEGLREILLQQLKAEDVIVRTTAATLLGDLGDSSDAVIKPLEDAFKAARNDKMNDARIAVLEAADKLKRPLNVQALADPTRDPDYVVRLKAFELLRQSGSQDNLAKLQAGPVDAKRNRLYYRRMSELAESKNPVAVIHTNKGDIRIELFASDAPMTVDSFIQLARNKFFDGLTFMRVVPNFVVQTGDPRNDQNGGPGYQIRCEINTRPYVTGAVGMALSGKDTGGSQFFITHSPQPHLDGGYTVFGQVVAGMDVVNRLARGDVMERVEIIGKDYSVVNSR